MKILEIEFSDSDFQRLARLAKKGSVQDLVRTALRMDSYLCEVESRGGKLAIEDKFGGVTEVNRLPKL